MPFFSWFAGFLVCSFAVVKSIDDGISGATTEHRDDFQRLIEDVKSGLINCVITNDTSRFARNVADAEYSHITLKQYHKAS